MARPRTAIDILESRGAYKNNPGRLAEIHAAGIVEIDVPKLGPPPESMTPQEKHAWAIVTGCHIPGYLTELDRIHVDVVSRLYAKVVFQGIDALDGAQLSRLMNGLGALGMNPADRGKLKATQLSQVKKPANPFGELNEDDEPST